MMEFNIISLYLLLEKRVGEKLLAIRSDFISLTISLIETRTFF